MNLIEFSRIIELQKAGKDPNEMKEEPVTPEIREPSAQPDIPMEPVRPEDPEPQPDMVPIPQRPRTVADLMAWNAWSANAAQYDDVPGSKRPAGTHISELENQQRPRTVADLGAHRVDFEDSDVSSVPVLKRSKTLLKRRPRFFQGDAEVVSEQNASLLQSSVRPAAATAPNLALGVLGPGYVRPVLGGRR